MIYALSLTPGADSKLEETYDRAMRELDAFFEIGWKHNRPNVILTPDRAAIDVLKAGQTESWLIGWADNYNVYLLDPSRFEVESNHRYSDERYARLLKHELAHCFTNAMARPGKGPAWLWEGIAIYLSGQNAEKQKPQTFKSFLDFTNNGGKGVYAEAGFAVAFLVEKYGKEKLLALLHSLKDAPPQTNFERLFKSLYGFDLVYENFSVPR